MLPLFSGQKTEAAYSSETSVSAQNTTRCHSPEDWSQSVAIFDCSCRKKRDYSTHLLWIVATCKAMLRRKTVSGLSLPAAECSLQTGPWSRQCHWSRWSRYHMSPLWLTVRGSADSPLTCTHTHKHTQALIDTICIVGETDTQLALLAAYVA
jgi:hypothetical protein